MVRRAAELHRERREELAAIIVREMGKVKAGALGEVDFAANITEYYVDQAEVITADQPLTILGEGTAVIRRSPLGVLLGIMPWNFPYYQVARFAPPNLVLGNAIVLKHAAVPGVGRGHRGDLSRRRAAGGRLPQRLCQQRAGRDDHRRSADPRRIGDRLAAGRGGGRRGGGRHLKKVALELGGSDPFLLLATDDLDAAVAAATDARLDNTGQSCNGAKRFIVVDELYEAFLTKFTAAMVAAPVGDPLVEETVLGPLSSVAAATRLQDQVDRAVAQGATVVTGGSRDGAYYPPTVLTGVTPEMEAYREEFFGPVGVVYRVADEDARSRWPMTRALGWVRTCSATIRSRRPGSPIGWRRAWSTSIWCWPTVPNYRSAASSAAVRPVSWVCWRPMSS